MYIDLLLLFLVIVFAVLGYIHGFTRQILSLLMILSIIFFAHPMAMWIKGHFRWPWFSRSPELVAWGLCAIAIIFLFMGVSGILALIKKNPTLEPSDRWLGLGLGALKGLVIAANLALLYQVMPENLRARFADIHQDTKDSYFVRLTEPVLEWEWHSGFSALRKIRTQLKNDERGIAHRRDASAMDTAIDED